MKALDLSSLKPIRDMVYEALREGILKGDLKAGDRLIESETAAKMKVSRTPVREAIRMLEKEGLVEYVARKGIFVKGFSRQDIVEIYSIRSALEVTAVSYTVEKITPSELLLLKEALDEMRSMTESGDVSSLLNSARRFNDMLVESCKMPRLINLISTYQGYLSRFRTVTLGDRERRFEALQEHEAIIQAIEGKDTKRAQEIVRQHLENALREHLRHVEGD